MAAKWSRVERKVHRDEKVRKLSKPPPNARDLWMYLLTCDSQTAFPGLYVLRVTTAADDLEWPVDDTKRMLDEVIAAGLAMFDPVTAVVWLPNAVRKRGDEALSKNTAKGWRNAWDELPACDLTRRAWLAAIDSIVEAAEEAETDAQAAIKAFSARPPSWLGVPPPASSGGDRNATAGGEAKPPRSPSEAPSNKQEQKQKDLESSSMRERVRELLDEHDPDGLIPDHPRAAATVVSKRAEALRGREYEGSDLEASLRAAVDVYAARGGQKGPGLFFTIAEQLSTRTELEKVLDDLNPDRRIGREPEARSAPRAKPVATPTTMAAITKQAIDQIKPRPSFGADDTGKAKVA